MAQTNPNPRALRIIDINKLPKGFFSAADLQEKAESTASVDAVGHHGLRVAIVLDDAETEHAYTHERETVVALLEQARHQEPNAQVAILADVVVRESRTGATVNL